MNIFFFFTRACTCSYAVTILCVCHCVTLPMSRCALSIGSDKPFSPFATAVDRLLDDDGSGMSNRIIVSARRSLNGISAKIRLPRRTARDRSFLYGPNAFQGYPDARSWCRHRVSIVYNTIRESIHTGFNGQWNANLDPNNNLQTYYKAHYN